MQQRPKVCLVQFRETPQADRLELASLCREMSPLVDVVPVCGVTGDVLSAIRICDGVILGGSGDFDFDGSRAPDDLVRMRTAALLNKLSPSLDYLFASDKPLFGICFGHQMMGAFCGASVYHDISQSKQRTHTVQLEENGRQHRLCSSLPASFAAHYGHKDVLAHVPTGATLLAQGGESCRVSVLSYSHNIVSTQFHPELSLVDVYERVARIPNYLPKDTSVEEVFTDAPHASTMLHNFARLCTLEKD